MASQNKILIVDDEEDIRDVLQVIIEANFEYEVIQARSGNEAIRLIDNRKDIGIVFSDYNMDDGNGGDLYQHIKTSGNDIPFCLVTTSEPKDLEHFKSFYTDSKLNSFLRKPFEFEDVTETIAKFFIPTADAEDLEVKEVEHPDYSKLRISKYLKVPFKCDIYIELSSSKKIKVVNAGDDPTEALEKYQKKGLFYVFIKNIDYLKFVKNSLQSAFDNLDDPNLSDSERTQLHLNSIETLHEVTSSLGVTKETNEIIDKVVEISVKNMTKNNSLKNLLGLLNGKESYIYEHAHLTSYIACAICMEMEWMNSSTLEKYVMASLFQNIALTNPETAKVFFIEDEGGEGLESKARDEILKHPEKALEMLKETTGFSEDTRSAILNHHEQPDGTGFPRGIGSTNISQFDALFILAVNFAHEVIVNENAREIMASVAKSYRIRYSEGSYKKVYEGFMRAFEKIIV